MIVIGGKYIILLTCPSPLGFTCKEECAVRSCNGGRVAGVSPLLSGGREADGVVRARALRGGGGTAPRRDGAQERTLRARAGRLATRDALRALPPALRVGRLYTPVVAPCSPQLPIDLLDYR